MANIKLHLDSPIFNGRVITFKSPTKCSEVSGLIIYYPGARGTTSKTFQFADAHGNNVGGKDLFAGDVLVKVILDTDLNRAYVQNADTNAYLEARFNGKAPAGYGLGGAQGGFTLDDIDTLTAPGWYSIVSTESVDTVDTVSANYWYLHVTAYGEGSKHCMQKLRPVSVSAAGTELIRYKHNGTWSQWEWVNPPMSLGVEYRTSERHCGKPVYTQLISLGRIAVNDVIMISGICLSSGTFRAVSLDGLLGTSSTVQNCTRTLNNFPGVDYFYATGEDAQDNGAIYLGTNQKFDSTQTYYAYARIKYTID